MNGPQSLFRLINLNLLLFVGGGGGGGEGGGQRLAGGVLGRQIKVAMFHVAKPPQRLF